jgi:hypothetical protein
MYYSVLSSWQTGIFTVCVALPVGVQVYIYRPFCPASWLTGIPHVCFAWLEWLAYSTGVFSVSCILSGKLTGILTVAFCRAAWRTGIFTVPGSVANLLYFLVRFFWFAGLQVYLLLRPV